ncbi:imidazole glycerol phosphate synthase subunit HisH [Planctomicrobium piriforme]|uniref:Imidazole glycerol phosphate synthase subunit HisH n=1 Tax=Planctomicrobium piriforme TaxID=1576369 RepID=A0A1I3DL92_9PLAN|nr:imidazole glycerol phosphate synthase subunit HisH [Planctomicrobium piriforme]SFH87466.1 glutamine amidotransferase [Planctomicrobium piriforme]
MIGIIDYGMGNLRSVQKAFEHLGTPAEFVASPRELQDLDGVILPGVGAFRDAIAELRRHDFVSAIHDYVACGRPLLGICLGQQLLFDRSYEDGEYEGLGLIAGDVIRFQSEPGLKIPHMGWNSLEVTRPHPLLAEISTGDYVYFVHSYHVRPTDENVVLAHTRHGHQAFASIVGQGNITATQFHPEKSQRVGLKLLQNFAEMVSAAVAS